MDYSYELGLWLGYPECCVKWFVEERMGKHNFHLTKEQREVNGNRGFIPCVECAKKVTAQTIGDLIKNRQSETPYPIYEDEHNFEAYFNLKEFKEKHGLK